MPLFNIVIDTNVVVSGLRSSVGHSYKVLQLIGTGKFRLHISVPLILEYQDVLLRQLDILTLAKADIDDVLDYFCTVGFAHEIYYLWRPTLRDPKDEMLLELGVKAQCDFIVTFNVRDFMESERFGIKAITPFEFLEKLGD